jgi:hypothetical protein
MDAAIASVIPMTANPNQRAKAGMTHTHPMSQQYPDHDHRRGAHGAKRRGRWLVAALALLLAACGGGGGGSSAPPPSGGGGTGGGGAANYYLSGPSGVDRGSGLPLSGVDAATATLVAIPNAASFSTALPSEIVTLPQWTVSGTSATAIGTRLRVWAGTDNKLYSTDLQVVAGSSAPVTTQVSNLSMAATIVCPGQTVLSDYANPANSALVFSAVSAGCNGTATDQFLVVPLNASASASPAGPSLNEPVDVARDASGAIKQVLWIMHGASSSQIGVSASVGSAPVSLGALTGFGINLPGSGDFVSLAVVPQANGSYVWVYKDTSMIMAVNTTPPATPVMVFQPNDHDTLSVPAVVDGTNVYLATTDFVNPVPSVSPVQYTCQVVRIPTSGTLSTGSGAVVLNEGTLSSGGGGLSLVGISGSDIVYFNNGVPNGPVLLEAIAKNAVAASTPTVSIDSAPTAASFTPAPILVANGVYYNVTGGSTNSTQVYFYNLNIPQKSPGLGANGSVLLGGVLASPAPVSQLSSAVYDSVLVAQLAGGASIAGATIIGFDGNGFNGAILGTLPTLLQGDSYTGVTLSEGPLQAGMPALLQVSGVQQSKKGNNATDLFEITPGTNGSLTQVTKNLQ